MMINIYLSPSTQEKNLGTRIYGTEEERMNILADAIQNILSDYIGINVYRNNPNWKLQEVITDSNYYSIDLHLALHSNANDTVSRGCEVYCHKFNTQSHEYAKIFYKNLEKITPTLDRGVKEGYNFYGQSKHMSELYRTKANAVLIEVAFHDNKDDANWIIKNNNLIAENIVDSILKIFEVPEIKKNIANFSDIEGHWAKDDIIVAQHLGLIFGYEDGTFRPNEKMTRAEVVTLIMQLYKKIRGV